MYRRQLILSLAGVRPLLLVSLSFYCILASQPGPIQPEIVQNLRDINTPFNDYMPFISPDGKMLFFQSDRPNGASGHGDFDLWMSRINDPLTDPLMIFHTSENLDPPINTGGLEGMASLRFLSQDEWEIYFTSIPTKDRQGLGGTDIFYSKRQGGSWNKPTQLVNLNTAFHERMPYISPDGKLLLFSSDRPGGFGGEDIWASTYDEQAGKWDPPFNLGKNINTKYDESSPAIHHDNSSLFFSSNRPGGLGGFDLYSSLAVHNSLKKWKPPASLGKPYNSQSDEERITMTKDGKIIYFSSNRRGGIGLFDIYKADAPSQIIPKLLVLFRGNVFETGTKKGIEANIQITDNTITNNISTGLPKGDYNIKLESGKSYQILVTAPGYEYERDSLDISKIIRKGFIFQKTYYLKRIKRKVIAKKSKKEEITVRPPIPGLPIVSAWTFYYQTNEYVISDKDLRPLKEVYQKWGLNPLQMIQIDGHTDSKGSKKYNIWLSQRRALHARERLTKMGVPSKKIKTAWYDFSRPAAVEQNEQGRSKNRRIEIRLRKN